MKICNIEVELTDQGHIFLTIPSDDQDEFISLAGLHKKFIDIVYDKHPEADMVPASCINEKTRCLEIEVRVVGVDEVDARGTVH